MAQDIAISPIGLLSNRLSAEKLARGGKSMHRSHLFAGASLAALLLAGFCSTAALADVTLAGQVSSAEEGPMEGVLVSAKKDGSTITTTVVSDDKGHYSFPAGRLESGHYSLAIRAIGYNLDGPKTIDLADGKSG